MQVMWLKDALNDLVIILEYGKCVFGERITRRFYETLLKNERIISLNPYIGKQESLLVGCSRMHRSLLVHKNYKLIYFIEKDVVYIIALFDVRKLPSSLVEEIEGR